MVNCVLLVDDENISNFITAKVLKSYGEVRMVSVVLDGKQGVNYLKHQCLGHDIYACPDLILLDLNMPLMDGFETLKWIQERNYDFKVLVLSMNDEEEGIVKSLRLGASGYLLKNVSPDVLKQAMDSLIKEGFYHNELVSSALVHSMNGGSKETVLDNLKTNELIFLKLCCTDKTYKEIAIEMILTHKTIDEYRQNLFEKLNVKSRVGLVLFAMQHKLID